MKVLLTLTAVVTLSMTVVACAPRNTSRGIDGQAYTPATGSARGVVVPNALPGVQTPPGGSGTAGSSVGTVSPGIR